MDGLEKRVERKENKAKENKNEEEKKMYSKEDLSNAMYEWFSQQDTDGNPRRSKMAIAKSWNMPFTIMRAYTDSDPKKRRKLENFGTLGPRPKDNLRGAVNEHCNRHLEQCHQQCQRRRSMQ